MSQNLEPIQEEEKQSFKAIKEKINDNFFRNKIVIKIFLSFLLILILLALIRIPYVGVFIDSTIFSFLFGFGKYLLYIYLITWLIFKLFNITKLKVILSKRFFLSIIMSTILLSVMFSGIELVNVLAQSNSNNVLNNTFINNYLDYWYVYIFKMEGFVFGKLNYIDGGLIGSLVATVNGIFIIIFAIICIILVYVIMFKSWRNVLIQNYYKIKNKQKKQSANNQDNTIQQEKLNFIECEKNLKTNKLQFIHNSDVSYISSLLIFDKPQHLTLNDVKVEIDANKMMELILQFMKENNIKFLDKNIIENPDYIDISFNLTDEEYMHFKNVITTIKIQLNEYDFVNIFSEGNLTFRFLLTKNIIDNSIQVILKTKISKPFNYVFGLNQLSLPIVLDLQKNVVIGIYDENKKNYFNLLNTIISSISWNYSYKNIEIVYLSLTTNENNDILQSPNCHHKSLNDVKDIMEYLNNLETQCKILINKFKDNNIKDVYEWNDKSSSIVTNKVVFINDIDLLMFSEPSVVVSLNNLIKLARYCGITFFIFDHSYDFKSYNKINYELLCLFKANNEISKYILNNSKAQKLVKFNDAILYDPFKKKDMSLFIPIFNDKSIKEIISILKKCHDQHQM